MVGGGGGGGGGRIRKVIFFFFGGGGGMKILSMFGGHKIGLVFGVISMQFLVLS